MPWLLPSATEYQWQEPLRKAAAHDKIRENGSMQNCSVHMKGLGSVSEQGHSPAAVARNALHPNSSPWQCFQVWISCVLSPLVACLHY